MSKAPRISEAEWEVMRILWDRHPLTAADLIAALAETHDWAPNTIRTMLARLVKKGVLSAVTESGAHLYTPLVERSACEQEEVDSLLDRLFDGSLQPLLVHFAKRRKLRPEQIEELRSLLDERKEEAP